jgi:hypothetical protein
MSSEPYNSLLKNRYADIKPHDARTFYIISCGEKGIIKPHTPATGVVFIDGSFLTIFEKWAVRDNRLIAYSYRYQIPGDISIRYDKDSDHIAADHPEHHLQTSGLGENIRLPTAEVRCEEVLQLIFEQFVGPKPTAAG